MLHILSNDLLILVGDDISAVNVEDFIQYFNRTWDNSFTILERLWIGQEQNK